MIGSREDAWLIDSGDASRWRIPMYVKRSEAVYAGRWEVMSLRLGNEGGVHDGDFAD
jgi:hypothetical protein